MSSTQKTFSLALLLALLITTAVFGRALQYDFVNLDDPTNLQKNPAMQQLGSAWSKPYLDAYLPLVYTVWNGIHHLSRTPRTNSSSVESWSPIPELQPAGFHAANLLLHAFNTALLFMILRTLFRSAPITLCAALCAVFLLHPLQVEAVAWVTALKDVLSGTFSLLLIFLYAQKPLSDYRGRQDHQRTALLAIVFLLACLSKSTRIFLPLWLMWLGHLHWRKPLARTAMELLQLFAIALLIGLIAAAVQPNPKDMAYQDIWRRPLVAGDALLFYAYKLLWPAQLAVDYGRNPHFLFESKQALWSWIPAAMTAIACWHWRARINPWLLAGLGGFVLSLLPVLGLKPFVFQTISTVSDRYCYLSIALLLLGLIPLLAAIKQQRFLQTALAVIAIALAARSFLQLPVWQNSYTLWQHTLQVTLDSAIANNNLASIHEQLGHTQQAIDYYERSAKRWPRADLCSRIAILYTDLQQWQRAAEWVEKGLAMEPDNTMLLHNRQAINAHLQQRSFRIQPSSK